MKKITAIFKTMLLVTVVLVMVQGCTSPIPIPPSGGTPSSNIIHRVYNYTASIQSDINYHMDIDGNGTNDIYFIKEGTFGAQILIKAENGNKIQFSTEISKSNRLYSYAYNEQLENNKVLWEYDNLNVWSLVDDGKTNVTSNNIDGSIFIGFRATDMSNNNKYYGWIRVVNNIILSNGNFNIIESGVCKIPNTPIKAGEY